MPTKKNFPLRIDPRLYAALEHWAADELRSVNAHIEFLLREAVRRTGRLNGHSDEASLQENLAGDEQDRIK
ncbi:MAG: type II toxin-antitoxin system antitoxin [Bacillota bacterium]